MLYEDRCELYRALKQIERGRLWRAFNALQLCWSGKPFPLTGPEMSGMRARPLFLPAVNHRVLCSGKTDEEMLATAIAIAIERTIGERSRLCALLRGACLELDVLFEPMGDLDVIDWRGPRR